MLYDWFVTNILPGGTVSLALNSNLVFTFYIASIFTGLMWLLFLWASFHLITDIIMAFRAVFGFGYKKRKGGSH